MITLTNKQDTYTVENVGNEFKLQGRVTIPADKRITSFSGSFFLEENYIGNFYYDETEGGKCSRNVNDVEIDKCSDLMNFLDESINELKQMINNNE